MRGYRKLLIAFAAILVAALVPVNEHQADIVLGVIYATMGANAAVHVGGAISGALSIRRDGSSGSDSRAPGIPAEEQGEGGGGK